MIYCILGRGKRLSNENCQQNCKTYLPYSIQNLPDNAQCRYSSEKLMLNVISYKIFRKVINGVQVR